MKIILFLAGLFITGFSSAQPSVKLYGYSQAFIPGMVRQNDNPDENGGQPAAPPGIQTTYYIYTAVSPGVTILPTAVWLAGKWDTIVSRQLQKTPVMTEHPEKKQLVGATKLTVHLLNPGDTLLKPPLLTGSLKKLMKENELVLAYVWKGKKYYAALKKLTELEPVQGL